VIQPGIIRTEFSATAAAEVRSEDGPYAAFNAAVVNSTKSVYQKGPLARLGGGPETVAKTIERAITARSPKIRYRVTPSARLLVYQRRLITDGMWDRFLATQFPHPGGAGEH
jgi:hypothetical protein